MLLAAQIIIVLILIATLIAVYLDDVRYSRKKSPHVIIEEVWLGKERRKAPRARVKLEATYAYPPNAYRKWPRQTHTENISIGGAKVFLSEKADKGRPIFMRLTLPGRDKPILVEGEIAWIAKEPIVTDSGKRIFATGIKFTHLKPAEEKEFSKYIQNVISLI